MIIPTSYLDYHITTLNSPKPFEFRGLGQAGSDYIDIDIDIDIAIHLKFLFSLYLRWIFGRAGFAGRKTGDKSILLPCPRGTFVKPNNTEWWKSDEIVCTKCPAGIKV